MCLAENSGIEFIAGCMLESKVSVTAAVHLAAAKSIIIRCDLDAPILCREDPIEGDAQYKVDRITLSDQSGLDIKTIGE
jgi:L-alanine-DL-glutamate epimerase-like enolase superfamily enzyme